MKIQILHGDFADGQKLKRDSGLDLPDSCFPDWKKDGWDKTADLVAGYSRGGMEAQRAIAAGECKPKFGLWYEAPCKWMIPHLDYTPTIVLAWNLMVLPPFQPPSPFFFTRHTIRRRPRAIRKATEQLKNWTRNNRFYVKPFRSNRYNTHLIRDPETGLSHAWDQKVNQYIYQYIIDTGNKR